MAAASEDRVEQHGGCADHQFGGGGDRAAVVDSGAGGRVAIDLARRLYAALAAGDRDELEVLLAPGFVGVLAEGMPFGAGGVHEGAAAMRREGWGVIGRHFVVRAEPERFLPIDSCRLLVTGRYVGAGRHGGGRLNAAFAHLVTVGEGRICGLEQYTDTARWLAAAAPAPAADPVPVGLDSASAADPAPVGLDSASAADPAPFGLDSASAADPAPVGLDSAPAGAAEPASDSAGAASVPAPAGRMGAAAPAGRAGAAVRAGAGRLVTGGVVELRVSDGLARVALNRPGRGNAIDHVVAAELAEVVTGLAEDSTVRAVLLSGAGSMFSVGGDLELLGGVAPAELPSVLRRMIDDYHRAIERLTELDAPVVVAVRGAAAGGGLGLVCAADIALAAEDAVFALGYARLGLTADGGTSWYLPRLLGLRRAQEMFLLNRRLTAAEAVEWGLVSRVVAAGELEAEACRVAEELAGGPTRALGDMRRLLRASFETGLRERLAVEREVMVAAAAHPDACEGLAAFTGHRRARFSVSAP